jgi:hypothetical protein
MKKCTVFIEGDASPESRNYISSYIADCDFEVCLFDNVTQNHQERRDKCHSVGLEPIMYLLWDRESYKDEKTVVLHYFDEPSTYGYNIPKMSQSLRFELDYGVDFYGFVVEGIKDFYDLSEPDADGIYRYPF